MRYELTDPDDLFGARTRACAATPTYDVEARMVFARSRA